MKKLSYIISSGSLCCLIIAGLHDLLWLARPVVAPPRYLWWIIRLPLPQPIADDIATVWPFLVGFIGGAVGVGLHVWAVRKEKRRKEGGDV